MTKLSAAFLALMFALGLVLVRPLDAALSPGEEQARRLELLVMEVSGCTVCQLVRLHIQPAYEASPRAAQIPMRYVDITSLDELRLGLNERVTTVPTIVLLRDGREVDRISGYMGPEHFFVALGEMLDLAAD